MPRDLSVQQRWALALSVLVVHGVVGWLISQARPAELAGERAPIEVQLIAPPQAPPVITPVPPPPAPVPPPKVTPPKPVLSTRAPSRNLLEAPPEPVKQPPVEAPPVPTPVAVPVAVPAVTASAASAVAAPAPAQPQAPKNLSISSVRRISAPELVYPPTSRRLNESGTVLLSIVVDERGKAVSVTTAQSSGFPRLDNAAIAVAKATIYQPYMENGVPRSFRVEAPYSFEPAD